MKVTENIEWYVLVVGIFAAMGWVVVRATSIMPTVVVWGALQVVLWCVCFCSGKHFRPATRAAIFALPIAATFAPSVIITPVVIFFRPASLVVFDWVMQKYLFLDGLNLSIAVVVLFTVWAIVWKLLASRYRGKSA